MNASTAANEAGAIVAMRRFPPAVVSVHAVLPTREQRKRERLGDPLSR
jgi:hypothetical protein